MFSRNAEFRKLAKCLAIPSLAAFAVLSSCSPHVEEDRYGTSQESMRLPDGRHYDSSHWAHDRDGQEYTTAEARKIRFRDAWMSFHNYDMPEVAIDRLEEFEKWFSRTPTDHVKSGKEEAFILELLG